MRRTWILALASVSLSFSLSFAACGGEADGASQSAALVGAMNPPGITLSTCGIVDGYVPPKDERPGVLSIDQRAWKVAPDAEVREDHLLVAGEDVCISAELDEALWIERAFAYASDAEF
jgi:hypothetical protein